MKISSAAILFFVSAPTCQGLASYLEQMAGNSAKPSVKPSQFGPSSGKFAQTKATNPYLNDLKKKEADPLPSSSSDAATSSPSSDAKVNGEAKAASPDDLKQKKVDPVPSYSPGSTAFSVPSNGDNLNGKSEPPVKSDFGVSSSTIKTSSPTTDSLNGEKKSEPPVNSDFGVSSSTIKTSPPSTDSINGETGTQTAPSSTTTIDAPVKEHIEKDEEQKQITVEETHDYAMDAIAAAEAAVAAAEAALAAAAEIEVDAVATRATPSRSLMAGTGSASSYPPAWTGRETLSDQIGNSFKH